MQKINPGTSASKVSSQYCPCFCRPDFCYLSGETVWRSHAYLVVGRFSCLWLSSTIRIRDGTLMMLLLAVIVEPTVCGFLATMRLFLLWPLGKSFQYIVMSAVGFIVGC